jgi:Domain of unknown function (DUF4258)
MLTWLRFDSADPPHVRSAKVERYENLGWKQSMSQLEGNIRRLAQLRSVVVSQHAVGRIANRNILFTDIVSGVERGDVIEDYPTYHSGPALLMLQRDSAGEPIHVVWGIETGSTEPAVIVTAYRPDPARWSADFRKRIP